MDLFDTKKHPNLFGYCQVSKPNLYSLNLNKLRWVTLPIPGDVLQDRMNILVNGIKYFIIML